MVGAALSAAHENVHFQRKHNKQISNNHQSAITKNHIFVKLILDDLNFLKLSLK